MSWPERVLLPVDFSACSEGALDRAVELIQGHAARISILHVDSGKPSWSARLIPGLDLLNAQSELRRLARETHHSVSQNGLMVETLLRQGAVVTQIIQTARETRADLIVIASHDRHGFSHLIHGSVAQGVLRLAPCPLLVLHPEASEERGSAAA